MLTSVVNWPALREATILVFCALLFQNKTYAFVRSVWCIDRRSDASLCVCVCVCVCDMRTVPKLGAQYRCTILLEVGRVV